MCLFSSQSGNMNNGSGLQTPWFYWVEVNSDFGTSRYVRKFQEYLIRGALVKIYLCLNCTSLCIHRSSLAFMNLLHTLKDNSCISAAGPHFPTCCVKIVDREQNYWSSILSENATASNLQNSFYIIRRAVVLVFATGKKAQTAFQTAFLFRK